MLDISGKWALVTGASRGIGRQIAFGLAGHGVNLVLHSSSVANQAETLEGLEGTGIALRSVEGDLADPESIAGFVEEAEVVSGGIEILFNNAALMTPETPLFETPQSDYERCFQVNLYAMIQVCSYFAPRMVKRGFGRIVNVSSGIKDTPRLDAYSLTKAAVDKYTRDLAVELEGSGVLANMLDPGWCRTDMGGPDAFNEPESVLPGALLPAMLGNEGPAAPKGKLFVAQDYAGVKWPLGTDHESGN